MSARFEPARSNIKICIEYLTSCNINAIDELTRCAGVHTIQSRKCRKVGEDCLASILRIIHSVRSVSSYEWSFFFIHPFSCVSLLFFTWCMQFALLLLAS